MLWLTLLRRFWPYAVGALAIIAAVLWYRGQINEAESRGYFKARAELQSELEREREHQREVNDEIDRIYYAEKTELQQRVRRLLARGDAIRMCTPAGEVRDASGSSGAAAASGEDGQAYRAGPDLRPRLVEYGAGCEAIRQQLEGWQRWYAER